MKDQYEIELLKRYREGTCTPEELELLKSWYASWNTDSRIYLSEEDLQLAESLMHNSIENKISAHHKPKENPILPIGKTRRNHLIRPLAVAALLILALSFGLYFYSNQQAIIEGVTLVNNQDIAPGSNRATLTLADGNTIALSNTQDGIIIGDENNIKYTNGDFVILRNEGSLSAKPTDQKDNKLTLSTPVGGQYQITLPDGTKVWLNAASTLKYPSHFGGKERRIELQGEAYFEVAKVEKQPFVVMSQNQEVTVLGTHFNIKAYTDEKETKTTLLEGSVKVKTLSPALSSRGTKDLYPPSDKHAGITPSSTTILSPGEQSIVTGENIKTTTIDPETVIDWKNGDFVFKGEDLGGAMRKIGRWYDMEIIYEPNAPTNIELGGWISRKNNLSAVLKWIESTNDIHFKLEERRIIVMK